MASAIVLPKKANYTDKSFKSAATDVWDKFFAIAPPETDVAYWLIEADSATVRLAARNSTIDEDGPSWDTSTPIVILVKGIIDALNEADRSTQEKLRSEFKQWVEVGLLESFTSSRISKKAQALTPSGDRFAIVTTSADEGLTHGELTLLWTNDKRFGLRQIVAHQAKAAARREKARAKKKPVGKRKR
jgi:hypothetical protein